MHLNSIRSIAACMVALVLIAPPAIADESIVIDASASGKPFPHFWEHMFGSGRAVLSLRDSYRQDMRSVRAVTGFSYVRFHAIFHDEVGLYSEDKAGNAVYNFSYIDHGAGAI